MMPWGVFIEVGKKYSGAVLSSIDDDIVLAGSLNTKDNAELNTWYASGTDKQVIATPLWQRAASKFAKNEYRIALVVMVSCQLAMILLQK